ncbi:MAG: cation:proton antiporter [Epsilonproteobacteria bacterium]|nr:cation:proton antiporter [Campylobacterota bacterium]
MAEISLIVTISLIIFLSPFLAKITKLPTSVLEIVLGTLSGAYGLLHHFELFELMAEFGFLYLMFLAGLEVDLKKILAMERQLLKRGILYIFLLYLFSFFIVKYIGFDDVFVAIFPLISVGLIATLKKGFKHPTPWLNLSFTIGTLGEVVSIAILTILSAGLEYGFSAMFYKNILILALFLILTLALFKLLEVLFWWYPELKTTLMPKIDNEEQDIRLSMALLFLFIALMLYLGLEVAFGAFIAGIFIATFFEYKENLPHKLSAFGFGFLVPIFFVYTGSSFKIEALLIEGMIFKAVVITFFMILIRVLASFVFYSLLKLKETLLFALSHSMPLTLLVAIATIAYHTSVIEESEYMAFILASILEVIVAMVTIRLLTAKDV